MIQSCFLNLISCFSLMSNAERRLKNVEFGKLVSSVIRHPSLSNLLLLGSCFLILATCLPAAGRILLVPFTPPIPCLKK